MNTLKLISILSLLLVSQMSFAQNALDTSKESPDFFETVVGARIQACKGHFDIEPYFVAAMGAQEDKRFTPEVMANAEQLLKTGRLKIPANKIKDPVAHSCAAFAEGMIVGSMSYQLGQALGQAVGKAMGEAIGETLKKVIEGLGKELGSP